jgi:hypothetical protein
MSSFSTDDLVDVVDLLNLKSLIFLSGSDEVPVRKAAIQLISFRWQSTEALQSPAPRTQSRIRPAVASSPPRDCWHTGRRNAVLTKLPPGDGRGAMAALPKFLKPEFQALNFFAG